MQNVFLIIIIIILFILLCFFGNKTDIIFFQKMSMAKNQRKNEKNNDMSDYIISEDAQNAFENGDYFVTSQPSKYCFV